MIGQSQIRMVGAANSILKYNDEMCEQCTHYTHTNANCFNQYPEKRTLGTRDNSKAPRGNKDSKKDSKRDSKKGSKKDKRK